MRGTESSSRIQEREYEGYIRYSRYVRGSKEGVCGYMECSEYVRDTQRV